MKGKGKFGSERESSGEQAYKMQDPFPPSRPELVRTEPENAGSHPRLHSPPEPVNAGPPYSNVCKELKVLHLQDQAAKGGESDPAFTGSVLAGKEESGPAFTGLLSRALPLGAKFPLPFRIWT